ncbi:MULTISPECIES: hypothetical protein [unclassified Sphingomonas]|uniref:hypothetical protein n=2 Tax=Sphingomonas TaxID=13687 RepID=UPI000E1092EA|nr:MULTISPECIES: hypothetical protein [unclassified Sphingomonas]AXJ96355.1 hypothetical protein DM480_13505 [Sphingomonas sp. FARSPH]
MEGWLEIGRPQGTICLIRPAGRTGFQDSALIGCGNGAPHRLMVNDDLVHGVITATMDDVVETFRYDPDTGELLSPSMPPPMTPSNFVPDDVRTSARED